MFKVLKETNFEGHVLQPGDLVEIPSRRMIELGIVQELPEPKAPKEPKTPKKQKKEVLVEDSSDVQVVQE